MKNSLNKLLVLNYHGEELIVTNNLINKIKQEKEFEANVPVLGHYVEDNNPETVNLFMRIKLTESECQELNLLLTLDQKENKIKTLFI